MKEGHITEPSAQSKVAIDEPAEDDAPVIGISVSVAEDFNKTEVDTFNEEITDKEMLVEEAKQPVKEIDIEDNDPLEEPNVNEEAQEINDSDSSREIPVVPAPDETPKDIKDEQIQLHAKESEVEESEKPPENACPEKESTKDLAPAPLNTLPPTTATLKTERPNDNADCPPLLLSLPIDSLHCIASFLSPGELAMFGQTGKGASRICGEIFRRVRMHGYRCATEVVMAWVSSLQTYYHMKVDMIWCQKKRVLIDFVSIATETWTTC
jgi:hypothetical protein